MTPGAPHPLRRPALPLLLAPSARAARGGGVVGFVEDHRGAPVAGAVISLFGKRRGRPGPRDPLRQHGPLLLPALPAGRVHAARARPGHRPRRRARSPCCRTATSRFTVCAAGRRPDRGAAAEIAAAPERRRTAASSSGCCATSAAPCSRRRTRRGLRPGKAVLRLPQPRWPPGCPTWAAHSRCWRRPSVPAPRPTGPTTCRASACPPEGPHRRLRPVDPGRPGEREPERRLAHGRRVRLRARAGHELPAATGYGTRYIRPLWREQRARLARPQRRRALRSGPLAHRRRGHGHPGRPLLLRGFLATLATRSVAHARAEARRAHACRRLVRGPHPGPGRRPAHAVGSPPARPCVRRRWTRPAPGARDPLRLRSLRCRRPTTVRAHAFYETCATSW